LFVTGINKFLTPPITTTTVNCLAELRQNDEIYNPLTSLTVGQFSTGQCKQALKQTFGKALRKNMFNKKKNKI